MNKFLFLALPVAALTVAGCGKDKADGKDYQQFVNNVMAQLKENLPENFTYEETKQDGVVVLENIKAATPAGDDAIKEGLGYFTGFGGMDLGDKITDLSVNIEKLVIDPDNKIVISNMHYSGAYNKDPHQFGIRNVVVTNLEFTDGEPNAYTVNYSNPYATGTYADLGRTMAAAFAKSTLPDPKIWDNLEQAFTNLNGASTVDFDAAGEEYQEKGMFKIPGILSMAYDVGAAGINQEEVELITDAFTNPGVNNRTKPGVQLEKQLETLTAVLNNAQLNLTDDGLLANYIKPVLKSLPQLQGQDPIAKAVATLTELENKPINDDDLTPEYKTAAKQLVSFAKQYLQGDASSVTVKLSPSKELAPTTAVKQQLENFQENYGITVKSK